MTYQFLIYFKGSGRSILYNFSAKQIWTWKKQTKVILLRHLVQLQKAKKVTVLQHIQIKYTRSMHLCTASIAKFMYVKENESVCVCVYMCVI